jgi:parallel beta-helix repeat protein
VIDVQCNDVLDIDFGQYKLNGDLVCRRGSGSTRSAALTITGEGVHFNLAGYTITRDDGTGRQLRQGIAVRGANAHINGGSIVDINCPAFGDASCAAIQLFEAPGARINGMSLHNNIEGILSLDNADGARIHSNDITGNLRIGIGLFGSAEGAMITGNDLSDTGGFSAPFSFGSAGYLGSSDDVSLIGNVANNSRNGISMFGSEGSDGVAERNTIRDNTTLDNERHGINIFGLTEAVRPRDNLIQSNTSFGNGNLDLREGISGVGAAPDCLNTWMDNDFDVAEPDCIE